MKNNELYKCPNCGSEEFKLRYKTYEEFDEEFWGEYLAIECNMCDGNYLAINIDQKAFKHAELAMLKEKIGEPLKNPKDIK